MVLVLGAAPRILTCWSAGKGQYANDLRFATDRSGHKRAPESFQNKRPRVEIKRGVVAD